MMIRFRSVNDSDIKKIQTLFLLTFKKKISKDYYQSRFLNKLNKYNSFIALNNNSIIAHVAFDNNKISYLNKKMNIYSRHTSMVNSNFRRRGVYSELCNFSFNSLNKNKNVFGVVIWPNLNNSKVQISNYLILNFNKHYIFKKKAENKISNSRKKNNDINFTKLKSKIIIDPSNFIYKDYLYFKSKFSLNSKNLFYEYLYKDKYIIYNFDHINKGTINILEYSNMNLSHALFENFFKDFNNFNFSLWLTNTKNIKNNFFKTFGFIKDDTNIFNIACIPFVKKTQKLNNLIKKTNFNMGDTDVFHKID